MKKFYNSPDFDIISFEQGDILAAISIVEGTGAADNESIINSWGNSTGSGNGEILDFFS